MDIQTAPSSASSPKAAPSSASSLKGAPSSSSSPPKTAPATPSPPQEFGGAVKHCTPGSSSRAIQSQPQQQQRSKHSTTCTGGTGGNREAQAAATAAVAAGTPISTTTAGEQTSAAGWVGSTPDFMTINNTATTTPIAVEKSRSRNGTPQSAVSSKRELHVENGRLPAAAETAGSSSPRRRLQSPSPTTERRHIKGTTAVQPQRQQQHWEEEHPPHHVLRVLSLNMNSGAREEEDNGLHAPPRVIIGSTGCNLASFTKKGLATAEKGVQLSKDMPQVSPPMLVTTRAAGACTIITTKGATLPRTTTTISTKKKKRRKRTSSSNNNNNKRENTSAPAIINDKQQQQLQKFKRRKASVDMATELRLCQEAPSGAATAGSEPPGRRIPTMMTACTNAYDEEDCNGSDFEKPLQIYGRASDDGGSRIHQARAAAPDELLHSEEPNTCPICLQAWTRTGRHQLCTLKSCGHLFGRSCVTRAVKNDCACPMCKKPATSRSVLPLYGSNVVVLDAGEMDDVREELEKERKRTAVAEHKLRRCEWRCEQLRKDNQLLHKRITDALVSVTPAAAAAAAQDQAVTVDTPAIHYGQEIDLETAARFSFRGGSEFILGHSIPFPLQKARTFVLEPRCAIVAVTLPVESNIAGSAFSRGFMASSAMVSSMRNGVWIINTADPTAPHVFRRLHCKPIRELALSPSMRRVSGTSLGSKQASSTLPSRMCLSVSLDKNYTVQVLSLQEPFLSLHTLRLGVGAWSCCWQKNVYSTHSFFVGTQDGHVHLFSVNSRSVDVDSLISVGSVSRPLLSLRMPIQEPIVSLVARSVRDSANEVAAPMAASAKCDPNSVSVDPVGDRHWDESHRSDADARKKEDNNDTGSGSGSDNDEDGEQVLLRTDDVLVAVKTVSDSFLWHLEREGHGKVLCDHLALRHSDGASVPPLSLIMRLAVRKEESAEGKAAYIHGSTVTPPSIYACVAPKHEGHDRRRELSPLAVMDLDSGMCVHVSRPSAVINAATDTNRSCDATVFRLKRSGSDCVRSSDGEGGGCGREGGQTEVQGDSSEGKSTLVAEYVTKLDGGIGLLGGGFKSGRVCVFSMDSAGSSDDGGISRKMYMASIDAVGAPRVWSLSTGECMQRFRTHPTAVLQIKHTMGMNVLEQLPNRPPTTSTEAIPSRRRRSRAVIPVVGVLSASRLDILVPVGSDHDPSIMV